MQDLKSRANDLADRIKAQASRAKREKELKGTLDTAEGRAEITALYASGFHGPRFPQAGTLLNKMIDAIVARDFGN